jgi:isoquinoline 1-oxidoreductase
MEDTQATSFESKLTSVETGQAEKVPGVTVVHDGDFVGVVASSQESAAHALGLDQARVEADTAAVVKGALRLPQKAARRKRRARFRGAFQLRARSIPDGLAAAHQKLERTYTVAYIAHAPLEPRAAVAEWTDGKLTVWTGTQQPFGVRGALAQALGVAGDQVRVIVPDFGGGFGGKHSGECAVEAARLAKAAGKPVKVTWSREEEFTWAYFRPAGVIDINCGATNEGMITAWEFHNYNSGASAIRPMYEIPNSVSSFTHPIRHCDRGRTGALPRRPITSLVKCRSTSSQRS